MKVLFYTFMYFCSSLMLSFFSSYFFSKNEYNFPYPIFVTGCQYLSQYLICKAIIYFLCRIMRQYIQNTQNTQIVLQIKNINDNKPESIEKKAEENIKNYKNKFINILLDGFKSCYNFFKNLDTKRFCCAIVSSLDISLSVYSLKTTSLAFYTMIKSSSPVFILLNCFIFNIESPSLIKLIIIFLISVGIFMTTINDNSINLNKDHINSNNYDKRQGFILLFASFVSGFRWALIQYLLQDDENKQQQIYINNDNINNINNINNSSSLNTNKESSTILILKKIKDLALPISICLFTISFIIENPQKQIFVACNLRVISYSCILSVILIVSEFMLVGFSSVMYLSLASIVKEIFIIIYSVIFKGLRFSKINTAGLIISIIGILLFSLNF